MSFATSHCKFSLKLVTTSAQNFRAKFLNTHGDGIKRNEDQRPRFTAVVDPFIDLARATLRSNKTPGGVPDIHFQGNTPRRYLGGSNVISM